MAVFTRGSCLECVSLALVRAAILLPLIGGRWTVTTPGGRIGRSVDAGECMHTSTACSALSLAQLCCPVGCVSFAPPGQTVSTPIRGRASSRHWRLQCIQDRSIALCHLSCYRIGGVASSSRSLPAAHAARRRSLHMCAYAMGTWGWGCSGGQP